MTWTCGSILLLLWPFVLGRSRTYLLRRSETETQTTFECPTGTHSPRTHMSHFCGISPPRIASVPRLPFHLVPEILSFYLRTLAMYVSDLFFRWLNINAGCRMLVLYCLSSAHLWIRDSKLSSGWVHCLGQYRRRSWRCSQAGDADIKSVPSNRCIVITFRLTCISCNWLGGHAASLAMDWFGKEILNVTPLRNMTISGKAVAQIQNVFNFSFAWVLAFCKD
jgi:hypothetical protein